MTEPDKYCGTYCEHNAHGQCDCQPCAWIRENTGFAHEFGCPFTDTTDPSPQPLQ
jgi:hypothetical protein